MTDRTNRVMWVLIAVMLTAVGGGGLSLALGAWGHAGPVDVVDPTVVRWWGDGGWMSFASVAFIGLVLVALGLVLVRGELRHQGTPRLADFDPCEGYQGPVRGRTMVRAAPVAAALEADLKTLRGVRRATVGLFGRAGDLEVRARLEIGDEVDLASLSDAFGEMVERFVHTSNLSPSKVEVTLSLVGSG